MDSSFEQSFEKPASSEKPKPPLPSPAPRTPDQPQPIQKSERKSPREEAREIAKQLGHNNPDLIEEYLKDEDH